MDPRNPTPLVTSASASDPQTLLAAYPFASATPSAHVARHLGSLSTVSSAPSFISHTQQQYRNDPYAQQYAARALQAEASQQGYTPPARWAPSDYIAPIESHTTHAYDVDQSYNYRSQQAQYPQNTQNQNLRRQSLSSAYPYSPQQHLSSTYPSVKESSYQSYPSAMSAPTAQPHSYSHQSYPAQTSGTSLGSTSSTPTSGGNNTYYSHATARTSSYSSQPAAPSTYPSQTATASSYSQPASSATSYPTQPSSHPYISSADSISSSFLAPLASHQFAPRLSHSISTLHRSTSDVQAQYSNNANPRGPPLHASQSRQHSSSVSQPETGLGYTMPPSGHSNQTRTSQSEQYRAGERVGAHPAGSEQSIQQVGGYQTITPNGHQGAHHYRNMATYQGQSGIGYQSRSEGAYSSQIMGGYQSQRDGSYQGQGRHPEGLGVPNFFQQQASSRPPSSYSAPSQGQNAPGRTSQQPAQALYTHQRQPQLQTRTEATRTETQSYSQQQARPGAQQPPSQLQKTVPKSQQPLDLTSQSWQEYSVASGPQLQSAIGRDQSPKTNSQPQSRTGIVRDQIQSQAERSSHIPTSTPSHTQPQHDQAVRPQAVRSDPQPQPASQPQPRIYAPLAGRAIRGRGIGRQPQRVLQNGPQRILTPPQPQGWTQNVPVKQQSQGAPLTAQLNQVQRNPQPAQHVQQLAQRSTQPARAPVQPAQSLTQSSQALADVNRTVNVQDSAVGTPMELDSARSDLSAVISDAGETYPTSPPPPYEPLVRERVAKPQNGSAQGQGAGGSASQLSILSQDSTSNPPQTSVQGPRVVQPISQEAPRKHGVEESAAHFQAFLSATVPARPKPSSSTQPGPANAPVRPQMLSKTLSSTSTSSGTRPKLSPVVELPQRSPFMTPRKENKWREPPRGGLTDTPQTRTESSPDLQGFSPMKRKRDAESEPGARTVKRMMSMTIDDVRTPTHSPMRDATMRTPGSGSVRTPGKYATLPSSKMRMVVEIPRKLSAGSLSQMNGMSTGKRDAHLEKLCTLIEEIIEAEDTLDPEQGGPPEWFSSQTTDWSLPLLAPSVISRLTQLVARRGMRVSGVETGNLSRILRILGRSVAKGEDLDPFGSTLGGTGAPSKAKGKGKKKGKNQTEEEVEEELKDEVELGEDNFSRLDSVLDIAKDAIIAADSVFAILSAEKLPKQLYSEDLITSCLAAVKNQLSSIIYPYVETASDVHGHSTPLLLHTAQSPASSAVDHRNLLGEIFRALNAALPRITALATQGISETMVIQAAFIGIGPFFVVEVVNEKGSKSSAADKKNGGRIQVLDALGGSTSMRGLRLTALGLVRALFANYESQRAWIVEEILSSLIKLPDMKLKAGQFKLRDGATIHVVSALLFQLVQTSAHDVHMHAKKLARKRREAIANASAPSQAENSKQFSLDEHDREEVHTYLNGLESATKTAKTIVLFLTQRTGKNKNTKSTNEVEYRNIFDNLIQDILVVLNWPEWPAANLLLGIVCKFMLSSLEDVKSSSDTAAKNIALDHLGEIATRLRETHLTLKHPFETTVKPLDEIVASCDLTVLDDLVVAHSEVYAYLSKRAADDQAYDSARELTAVTWAQELATSLRQCDSIISKAEDNEMEDSDDNLPELASRMKVALRNVWKERANDMFEAGTDAEVKRVDDLAERFGGTQGLRNAFEPILSAILMSLDAPAVFMRTKALRALGLIVTKDPSILKQPNVRRAIESHLMDSSSAVRDAAVELIGKYLVLSPELVDDYYPQIANRIADTGLAVRKRVIKLLKSLYNLTGNVARRVDICTKLVLRMLDEDDGVKDLAIGSIEELWFTDGSDTSANRRGVVRENGTSNSGYMTNKISVIMGVNANFRDRHSPLEDLLHEIIVRKSEKDSGQIVQRYIDVCDALIDMLVDAQEVPGFSVVTCIRTVHVFTAAHPTVMSTRKAVVLLPYLKSGATADDQAIVDYLLRIFRSCIPRMPSGTSKFGTELQQTLEPMVIKPSGAAGVAALPETVACLCAVVNYITHDYQRLVALLRSCNSRLVQVLTKQNQPSPQEVATFSILALIVALLGEHSDFDKIREQQPALKPVIDSVKQTSISEHIYSLIHQLYRRFKDPLLRGRLLQCFGFLFRAYPTLLTHDDSAELMDQIFASQQEEAQARLLKIMQEFLLAEAEKHSHATNNNKPKKAGAVNMDELIGNTDGFADSGVSSAIIQRYLNQILSSALSPNRYIQSPAVDILSFTVRQGLAHPLQCFPIIVALETSHDNSLSSRASNLHTLLHNKHASLLNSRYLESVGRSLEYQKQLAPGSWKGYRLSPSPTALLHRWYSLVREKRQPKLEFLKSFLRAFDVDVAVLSCSQDHLDLVRYIAENVSAFDYKTQEEVLTVIRHLTHVLSVAGMHIVEILSKEQRARDESGGSAMDIDDTPDGLPRGRITTIISIILVLKAHLKYLYGITEEKASRWVPGKKSAVGDKPAAGRHDKPISWDRVPFATSVGKTSEDVRKQEEGLLELWAEDGVTAEPDEFGE